jgi:GNAT superfamily N-acetyltransferase
VVSYRLMDETCLLVSCLHRGPVLLAQCQDPASVSAYVETISDIPQGTVARVLRDLSACYGPGGVAAVEDDMVVGKVRCFPQAVYERAGGICLQQEDPFRGLLALDLSSLPTRDQAPVLRVSCMQVAEGYQGRRIAAGMLDTLIDWAADAGWGTLVATAGRQIPPLLNWSGQPGCQSLRRRGFVVLSQTMEPALREGVVSQRQGFHGPQVQQEWNAFAELSDDEAAMTYEMALELR